MNKKLINYIKLCVRWWKNEITLTKFWKKTGMDDMQWKIGT